MSSPRFSRPLWHLVDARNQIVGRLASQVTRILRGKHKPTFTPNYDCGDYVVIVNAKDVKFTGNKLHDKTYKWHTGYPGGTFAVYKIMYNIIYIFIYIHI